MVSIALSEWEHLPIRADGADRSVTPDQADQLIAGAIAVERKLGMGSGEGASVLVRTHKALCARQVVGVLATAEIDLEILPKIDTLGEQGVRNVLVHMLAKAWDLPISDGEAALFSRQEKTLLEVLIRLFCERLFKAVHRGLSRRYLDHEEDLPSLKGRLDIQRQFSANIVTPSLQGPRHFILKDEKGAPRFATKPDIVVKGAEGIHIIDTKWKRLVSADVDTKRGVSQADVYQMLAYGQVYEAKRLTLLYPHHRGLGQEAGVVATFAMPQTGVKLEIATVDVALLKSVPAQCLDLMCWPSAPAIAVAS